MAVLTDKRNGDIIRTLYNRVASKQRFEQMGASANREYDPTDQPSIPPTLKSFYKFFTEVGSAFPDYELQIDNLVEKGNKIMVRYNIRGTHKGRFMGGAPTNEKTDIRGIDVFRLENGKIVYHWNSAYQINTLIS
jgi:predicted ester cyclase